MPILINKSKKQENQQDISSKNFRFLESLGLEINKKNGFIRSCGIREYHHKSAFSNLQTKYRKL